jgi:hypothetical protein
LRHVQNEFVVSLVGLAQEATEFVQKARILWRQNKGEELWYKKESGQESLPATLSPRRKWPRLGVLSYRPEVVEALACCAFALGMLM